MYSFYKGGITRSSTLTTNTIYTMYSHVRDNGTPELTTGTSATIRVDSYTPDDVIISFYLDLNQTYYESVETTFITQLNAVYQVTYPTASVKRWCISVSSGRYELYR